MRLHPDARPWFHRAQGEIELGLVLAMLGPEWTALHAVPLGPHAALAHLLIGPTGVYAVSAQHHRGLDVLVDDEGLVVGSRRLARCTAGVHEAAAAGRRLAAATGAQEPVIPVTVIVGERSFTDARTDDRDQPHVISSRDLLSWLQWRPAAESSTRLQLVRLAAEEPETWHAEPSSGGSAAIMTRFARLGEGVARSEQHLGSFGRTLPTVVDPAGIDAQIDAALAAGLIGAGASAVAAPAVRVRRSVRSHIAEALVVVGFGLLPAAVFAVGLGVFVSHGMVF
ncbi:nuclease-related domain-containing protein [Microcella daejeonensis]|uniref:Nuclease-related domain-containing protein n=1 Tax=Microcella daejeonensis TaxID=2994971 RepID=A0A9E8MIX1_9MICO|nr:nuclease-related domain-containing protein [Microcella daejeonensis]WAB80382.1 nuclease-related domain-containing protein [Microcella daejeonensis]